MNAIEWYNSRKSNETLAELLEAYAKDYFQWKELQKTLVEDLTQRNSLSVIVNQFVTAGDFHISHIFDFIWPTDEAQYQEYADKWENILSKNGIIYHDAGKLFPDLKKNPVVESIVTIDFNNNFLLRLYVHQNNPTRYAQIDFELVSSEYMKLKGIVL